MEDLFLLEEVSEENCFEDMMAMSFSTLADENIKLFAIKYFSKDMENLTEEEQHHIDCWGAFGCTEWLTDNGFL